MRFRNSNLSWETAIIVRRLREVSRTLGFALLRFVKQIYYHSYIYISLCIAEYVAIVNLGNINKTKCKICLYA